jgi:hypothetical protein
MVGYRVTANDPHGREEELQWARIVSTGNTAAGMALVFVQKLCTAFHEFEPAWRAGALNERYIGHFRDRLAARARRVLDVLEGNELSGIDGAVDLAGLLRAVESAVTMDELADLAEEIHAVNHMLCDSLEMTKGQGDG